MAEEAPGLGTEVLHALRLLNAVADQILQVLVNQRCGLLPRKPDRRRAGPVVACRSRKQFPSELIAAMINVNRCRD